MSLGRSFAKVAGRTVNKTIGAAEILAGWTLMTPSELALIPAIAFAIAFPPAGIPSLCVVGATFIGGAALAGDGAERVTGNKKSSRKKSKPEQDTRKYYEKWPGF